MTQDDGTGQGRFKRLWMELEVEIEDEMALRTFDLHLLSDGEGGVSGMLDPTLDERLSYALSRAMIEAWALLPELAGVKVLSASGPLVRHTEGDDWAEVRIPKMPKRRDDGTLPDFPVA